MIFRNWVLENFPFLEDDFDALTDYELFCKMMEYVKKFAKDNEDFGKRLTDLENYVNNYFENLDVQEEINNKLDEMAESGELTDIIAQYLGLAGLLIYDTVSDMKLAENLVNGSTAKTLGYNSIDDMGGSFYKIRNITNQDVVDESFIIALNNPNLVAELIIKPSMNITQFGVVEDSDISLKLQSIINDSNIEEINLLNNDYLIGTTINLKSNLILKNGNITGDEITNVFYGININNFKIDNINIDGDNSCQNGIYLMSCKDFSIINSKFYNFEIVDDSCCGITPHSCTYGYIGYCEIYDIGNNSVGDEHYEPRGLIIANSTNIHIDQCYIHDIYTNANHGDGVHFDSPFNREMSKNIISNCTIEDCIYRGIKIQQRGVTVDNCKIIEGTNNRELQQSAIAIYDNDITIKNSFISQLCSIAITIGSSSEVTSTANNVTIDNNIIDFKKSISYGVITVPNIADMVENLNITNNKITITDESKKPYHIYLLGKINKVNICNNIFNGGESFVVVQKASGATSQSRQNLVITGNTGVVKQSLVEFKENVEISYGTITGNNAYYDTPLDFVSGQNSVRVNDVTLYKTFKIGNNNIGSSGNIFFYDGPRSYGGSTVRPTTAVNNGFQFFDTTLHQMLTFYNGSWYKPDGTVAA